MPRPGMVTLTPSVGSALTLILNAEPDRGGGVGGWQSTQLAFRRPGKWWQSIPDDTMTLDCTLDLDAIGGPTIERRLDVLRAMGQAGQEDEPPSIMLSGDLYSSDTQFPWILQDFKMGARLWTYYGDLRRQQVTLDFERFNDMDPVEPMKVKGARTASGKRKTRTVRSKQGDTVRAVALRELGDATRWNDIRSWNKSLKKIDPDATLRTGTKIVLKA